MFEFYFECFLFLHEFKVKQMKTTLILTMDKYGIIIYIYEMLSNLSVLKDSELIYERGIYPQSAYIFKHALTREVVYDSILTKRKKKLHEEIGEAIEELYKDNIHEHCFTLVEHFIESESYEKGANYSRQAAKREATFSTRRNRLRNRSRRELDPGRIRIAITPSFWLRLS